MLFFDSYPEFKIETRFILPVTTVDGHKDLVYFGLSGMYYVTDSRFSISVFDEQYDDLGNRLSGYTAEQLLKKL